MWGLAYDIPDKLQVGLKDLLLLQREGVVFDSCLVEHSAGSFLVQPVIPGYLSNSRILHRYLCCFRYYHLNSQDILASRHWGSSHLITVLGVLGLVEIRFIIVLEEIAMGSDHFP